MKVTRWEEKLFNVLVDPIKESIDERKIESKLNYYYQRLDTQDLVVAGRIGDVENNYQLFKLTYKTLNNMRKRPSRLYFLTEVIIDHIIVIYKYSMTK